MKKNNEPIVFESEGSIVNPKSPLYEYQWNEKSEELLIVWNTYFTHVVTSINSWSQGILVVTHEGDTAIPKPAASDWHLPILIDINSPPQNLVMWLDRIPKPVLEACKLFGPHALTILELSSKHHAVAELLASNSILFSLWYFYCQERNVSESKFIHGCSEKRHHLLCYFEYPDAKVIVRILQKIVIPVITKKTLNVINHFFRRVVKLIPIAYLSHKKSITINYIISLSTSPWFYSSPIFNNNFSDLDRLYLERILEYMNNHGTIDQLNIAVRCKSFKELAAYYEHNF